jgi:hypothetical protein
MLSLRRIPVTMTTVRIGIATMKASICCVTRPERAPHRYLRKFKMRKMEVPT